MPATALTVPGQGGSAAFTASGSLFGVAASGNGAWAAGTTAKIKPQILRWNGTAWKKVPTPDPGGQAGDVFAVAALSSGDAWAVGGTGPAPGSGQNLILRWNGSAWKTVPCPNVGSEDLLSGVAVTSATDAWAVGRASDSSATANSFIVHWNGKKWTHVRSPNPVANATALAAVAASSPRNAWAVGTAGLSNPKAVILHWNGKSWKQAAALPGSELLGVTVTSATNAWAAGSKGLKTLIMHWNGKAWQRVPSPTPPSGGGLSSVSATSVTNAWAVGDNASNTSPKVLLLHWNGKSWIQTPAPPPGKGILSSVAGSSASNAWAVGRTSLEFAAGKTVILHWNGHAWVPATHVGRRLE